MSGDDHPPERPGSDLPEPELPAPAPDAPPEQPAGADLDEPRGLLGLLLWPLRAAIELGLLLFAAFVSGVLGALIPGLRSPDEGQGTGDDGPDGR